MQIHGSDGFIASIPSSNKNEIATPIVAQDATAEEASKNAVRLATNENGDLVGYGTVYRLEGVEFVVPDGYESFEQYLNTLAPKPARTDPYTNWDPYEAHESSNARWMNTDFDAEYVSAKKFVEQAFDYFLDTTQSRETLMDQHSQMLDTLSGPIDDTTTFTIGNISLSLKDLKTIAQVYQKNNKLIVDSIDLERDWGSQAVYSIAFAATKRDIAASLGSDVSKMTADSLQKTYEDRIRARHNPFWWQDMTREAIAKYGSPEAARDARLAAQGIAEEEKQRSGPSEKSYFQGHWGDIDDPHSFYADMHKKAVSMDVSDPAAVKESIKTYTSWVENGFKEEHRISLKYWGATGVNLKYDMDLFRRILTHFGF